MKRDVVAAQRLLARLLTDVQARRAWNIDPWGFASKYLSGRDEIAMIANLEGEGVAAAALHLDVKRVTSRSEVLPFAHPKKGEACRFQQPHGQFLRSPPSHPAPSPCVGLGYWPELYQSSAMKDLAEVWELRIDDFLDPASFDRLLSTMAQATVVIHSVDLSVGSPEATTDARILGNMRCLLKAVGASELSDHLGFTRVAGVSLGHFQPIWRTQEALDLIAENIMRLQDSLDVRIALENIAPLFDPGGEMTVAEFLNELVLRTGCGILLDITNLTLTERNGYCDSAKEIAILNLDAVVGVHLAGGTEFAGLAYDAHAFPVPDSDIAWLERILPHLRKCRSVVVERDGRREEVSEVAADLQRVRMAVRRAGGKAESEHG